MGDDVWKSASQQEAVTRADRQISRSADRTTCQGGGWLMSRSSLPRLPLTSWRVGYQSERVTSIGHCAQWQAALEQPSGFARPHPLPSTPCTTHASLGLSRHNQMTQNICTLRTDHFFNKFNDQFKIIN